MPCSAPSFFATHTGTVLALQTQIHLLIKQEVSQEGKRMRTTARALTSRPIVAMVSAIIMGWSASANASSLLFAYSYTGSGIAGAGILTTTDTLVAGAYTITGIQGLLNADMLTLLSPGAYLGNDNSLLASAPFLDYAGLSVQAGGVN